MEPVGAQAEVEKCAHFTIRGYVAEVRKKDRKLCWPFSIEEQGEQLPPLHVPKFRYWACEVPVKNANTDDLDENLEISNSHNSRPQPCVEPSHVDAHIASQDAASMSLSGSQPESGERTSEEKKDDTGDILYVNEAQNSKPFCIDSKEDGTEVREDAYPPGSDVAAVNDQLESNEDGAEKIANKDSCLLESHGTSKDANETSLELMLLKMKRKCMKESKTERYNKRTEIGRKNLTKINQTKKYLSDSVIPEVISEDSNKNEAVNALAVHRRKLHPMEFDESDDETSEEEEMTIRHENLGRPSHKKKPRKSRTLNDILKRAPLSVSKQGYGRNEDDFVGLVETVSEQSSSESDTTLGIDLNLSPTHQMDKKRKKKMIQDEDEEPFQINYEGDVPKKVGVVASGDNHTSFFCDQLVTSRKERNTSTGGNLHSEFEPPMVGRTDTDDAIADSNNGVFNQVLDGMFSLMHSKRSRMPHMKIGDSSFRQLMENPAILRRRPDILKQQNDQRPYKTSDTGSDDIPMDIVELMAKHQHERLLGASVKSNCVSTEVNNSIPIDNTEALGNVIPRFLQEKKSEKQRKKSYNEAKRVGSSNLTQLAGVSQYSTPRGIHCLPEKSHASTFSPKQDKALNEAQLFDANSYRNSGNQNSSLLKNQGKLSTRAQLLVGSSSRECSRQNSTFLKNWGKRSSEAQFLFGSSTSGRDFGNHNSTSSKSQDTSSEVQLLFGGSSMACGNQNSTFFKNHEKPASRTQFLAGDSNSFCANRNSNLEGKLGHRYAQNCLQTSDQYHTSQSVARQNSYTDDRHAWSSMVPNCLPFRTSKPQKFAAESNAANDCSQGIDFFPKQNMNVDHSVKQMDPLANHLEKTKTNLNLEATKKTHPVYPFACRESGVHLNLQPMQPLDLHNNGKIPATHLLRLMDPSTAINADVNQKFTPQHCLPHDYRQQEISRFVYPNNNEALMVPPSSMSFNRIQHSRKFGESSSFPEVQTVGSSAQLPEVHVVGSFAPVPEAKTVSYSWKKNVIVEDKSCSRNSNQLKGKTKGKGAPTQYKSPKVNKTVSEDGNSVKKHGLTPIWDLGKRVMCTPEYMGSPIHPLSVKDSTKRSELEVNRGGPVSPRKRSYSTEDCSLNRNPAEFTLPDIGNEFMNGPQDFKPKKNALSREKNKLIQLLGNKRQKIVKLAAIKDMLNTSKC